MREFVLLYKLARRPGWFTVSLQPPAKEHVTAEAIEVAVRVFEIVVEGEAQWTTDEVMLSNIN